MDTQHQRAISNSALSPARRGSASMFGKLITTFKIVSGTQSYQEFKTTYLHLEETKEKCRQWLERLIPLKESYESSKKSDPVTRYEHLKETITDLKAAIVNAQQQPEKRMISFRQQVEHFNTRETRKEEAKRRMTEYSREELLTEKRRMEHAANVLIDEMNLVEKMVQDLLVSYEKSKGGGNPLDRYNCMKSQVKALNATVDNLTTTLEHYS